MGDLRRITFAGNSSDIPETYTKEQVDRLIAVEAGDRDAADIALRESINNEITQRTEADTEIQERINNIIAHGGSEVVQTIWERSEDDPSQTKGFVMNLSRGVSNFDFIDIYAENGQFERIQSTQGWFNISTPDVATTGSAPVMGIFYKELTVTENTITIDESVHWEWDGSFSYVPTIRTSSIPDIVRVCGVKYELPVELTDIRVGANGITYPTAGDAVRGQYTELKEDLSATIGLTEESFSIFTPDDSMHLYMTKRSFFYDTVPVNSRIDTVSFPVNAAGGSGVLKVELWELGDDGDTLTKVKEITPTIQTYSTNVVSVNYFTQNTCYISLYFENVQVYNVAATGKTLLYDSTNNADASTLSISSLGKTTGRNAVGGFDYTTLSTAFDKAYRLPIKWRQGTVTNGNMYFTLYGCVTDFIIPTSICDRIKVLNSNYTLSVNYYTEENGIYTFVQRVAFSTDYTINKSYDYFVVNIFKNWSEQTLINQCDDIVALYVTLPFTDFTASIIKSGYHNDKRFNIRDMWSMAHQGYNSDGANHNKKGGYVRAALRGFTHGECDVKLTSDGIPVCCHDDTFTDLTSGNTITIANETYANLITYNYYGGTIATLEEIITECKQCGLHLEIDQVSTANAVEVSDVVAKLSAWDICVFSVTYMNDYPSLASDIVSYIQSRNANARFLIGFNGFSNYENAVAFTKTLDNAVFAIGGYTDSNFEALKQVAILLNGEARLHIWTVDMIATLKNALPYINGWTSNAISGDDIFNPAKGCGLDL